jgi:hypothetical protein
MDVSTARRMTGRLAAVLVATLLLGLGPALGGEPLPLPAPVEHAPPACVLDAPYAGMPRDPAAIALGAGGCATASCHGGPAAGNHDVQSFAATLWTGRDPHARAFATLHEPRSQKMAALLGIGPAHRAKKCLDCHSTQADSDAPLAPAVLADGVACGSCHGDATDWISVHHLPDWKRLDPESRARLGYRDLSNAGARVRSCIPCHVGDASREVDHDMIAAGHPRLAFEFAAYQRLWPRHWSPQGRAESQADFTERSWAVGQAETIAAVARLLEARAGRAVDATERHDAAAPHDGRWPEFAEFDCYACHRALSPERVAKAAAGQFANPAPGVPSWQPWSVAAARSLATATNDPTTKDVASAADALRAAIDPAWAAADRERLERTRVLARRLEATAAAASGTLAARDHVTLDASPERLDAAVAADPPGWRTWDAAVQTYLLMDSALDGGPARLGLWHGQIAPADSRTALDELRASLRYPAGAGGPDGFDPARFQRDRSNVR